MSRFTVERFDSGGDYFYINLDGKTVAIILPSEFPAIVELLQGLQLDFVKAAVEEDIYKSMGKK